MRLQFPARIPGQIPAPIETGARGKGLALAVFGVLLLSPDTLFIRLIGLEPWAFLAWRGLFMAIGLTVMLWVQFRSAFPARLWAIGRFGIGFALVFAISNMFFQFSIETTSVANTLVILATAPLFAVIFSMLLLRELPPLRTWFAILASMIGIAAVFYGELESGDWFGNLAAIGSTIGLGLYFVLSRLARPRDMTPALIVSGLILSAAGFVMSDDLYLPPQGLALMSVLGFILLPASFILLTRAPQYITAPEVSLILLLETILGPLWVWLAIAEEPPVATLMGGTLIVLALLGHGYAGMRASRLNQLAAD